MRSRGFAVRFVDVVIVAEKPKLAPFVPAMRATLARVLGVPVDAVSVKATTTEGMGPEGEGKAMSARAVGVVGDAGLTSSQSAPPGGIVSTTVFVLGAGASAMAGAPVMANFLDVAHDLWKMKHITETDGEITAVFQGISDLQRVHSKSQLDIANIESVFAAFEMARLFGRFSDYDLAHIEAVISGIRALIVRTIERRLVGPVEGKQLQVPRPYADFTGLIRFLRKGAKPNQSVAIVTFNYDVAVDFALHHRRPGRGLRP